ncbi:MAG TPA: alpha-L-fucosidase [Bacteroidales bacterium]|nr:alpha-L-fucosidase [Bacteroidales bacterium]
MKKTLISILILAQLVLIRCQAPVTKEERLEWWKDARFGMFIHWGPVSIKGTEIGWSRGREWTIEEYDNLYKDFNPVKFNAREWVQTAKAAGMKYIIFTSKHHDGFCNWDTKFTDYNIMKTPFKRDVMKELSEACKKEGIALGFYHSTCDWHHPDFPLTSPGGSVKREVSNLDRYTEYLKNQSSEIIKEYGPLLVMWYDVPQQFDSIRGQSVIDHIRRIQPDILVNNRTGAKGDFDTPEQRVGSFNNTRPWETCMTIGRQWAWKPDDEVKSLEQCLHSLIRSAGGDGNLLFNVGPRPDGTIEPLQVERLKEMGQWLTKYGYTIYGTRGGPFKPTDWGVSTRKGTKVYLHILRWSGGTPGITIPDIGIPVINVIMAGGNQTSFVKTGNDYLITVDEKLLQPVNTIVEIEYERDVMGVNPADVRPQSVSFMKPVNASSNLKPSWINHEWVDLKAVNNGEWSGSFWKAAEDDKQPWVEMDLGKSEKISKIILYESGRNIRSFELQSNEGSSWKAFYKGTTVGEKSEIVIDPVEARVIRFQITSYSNVPGIYEMMMFN